MLSVYLLLGYFVIYMNLWI